MAPPQRPNGKTFFCELDSLKEEIHKLTQEGRWDKNNPPQELKETLTDLLKRIYSSPLGKDGLALLSMKIRACARPLGMTAETDPSVQAVVSRIAREIRQYEQRQRDPANRQREVSSVYG